MKYWALFGFWHGEPFAIYKGHTAPPFSVWFEIDKAHWQMLRRESHYTRKQRSRPTDYIERGFQSTTPRTLTEVVGAEKP